MTLTHKACNEFLKTHLALLLFVGQKKKIVPLKTNLKKFLDLNLKIKFKCREAIFNNEDLIDEYIASNFDHLTDEQIKIVNGFKMKVKSNFVILKCLTNHAIFIDSNDNKFYAVKALTDPFDTFFHKFPVYTSTALIPFKDKIIYDGFFQSSGIYIGPNLTKRMAEEFKIAKQNKKIIDRLDT